jgi:hypothetical protein
MATQIGISQKEALLMPIGEFFDVYELWVRKFEKDDN